MGELAKVFRLVAWLACAHPLVCCAQYSFTDPVPVSGTCTGVSGDGATIVGWYSYFGFSWNTSSGFHGIPTTAYGASSTGAVVVGGSNANNESAYYWTLTGGVRAITGATAQACSGDGRTITGWLQNPPHAFRWTAFSGSQSIGVLPGNGNRSWAFGMNDDGSVIVGGGERADYSQEAFRWTSASGMESLGDLPGGQVKSVAYDVSANGLFAVGQGTNAGGQRAVLWSWPAGPVDLGGFTGGVAYGVSRYGNVIVGKSSVDGEAFLWTPGLGMVSLRDFLVLHGVPGLTDWQLTEARGVSDDGTVIVGTGRNQVNEQRVWRATIVNPNQRQIAGSVTFLDLLPSAIQPNSVEMQLLPSGSTTPIWEGSVSLGAGGAFSFTAIVTPGLYNLTAKGTHWLRKKIAINTSPGNVSGVNFMLINGDIDGDNEVSISDYAILSSAYGSQQGDPNWVANSDLDGDLEIGISDYAILSANFGLSGD